MFYLCQTTATLLSPTKKGWKRKCVHSLSSETAPESQQPQPQMFFPFPLKPTKHSLESFRSVFPIFFLVFATSDLTGKRAGRKNPLETLHLFLKSPQGFFPPFTSLPGCSWVVFPSSYRSRDWMQGRSSSGAAHAPSPPLPSPHQLR